MLSPQQKLQIMREMDNKVSISLSLALSFFEAKLKELADAKAKDYEKIIRMRDVKRFKPAHEECILEKLLNP